MSRLAIGIDIGGTNLRAARVSAGGGIQSRRGLATRREPEATLADCLALIAELRTPEVDAVGVGVPGQVDAQRREVLSGGYVDLSSLQFADRLAEATGLPVVVENDGAMALLGEQAHGAARGHGNVVLLAIGTGIGGAILEGGRLLRGRRSAGQLGHLVVEPEGLPCLCGKRGCVETTTAGPALARLLAQAGLSADVRTKALLARRDDPAAQGVLEAWVQPLRRAIDSLVATLDPDLVLLAGGLGADAAAALDRLPGPAGWFGAPVRAAELGSDAGLIGAAAAALRQGPAKRALLVNGVPASGKSTVSRQLSDALGWPLLSLDTIKQPFLDALPPGDRSFNRTLGRASMAAIFAALGDAPDGTDVVLDAWWGLQPPEVVAAGLTRAGIGAVAEIWCEAPAEEVGRRYAARAASRGSGHPGLDYVPELVQLAARARPTGLAPLLAIDTTRPTNVPDLARWVLNSLGPMAPP